jgi:selenocysteine lyase/cysteine desulfurase
MNPERRLFLSRSASAVFGLAAVAGLRAAEGTSASATLPAFDQRDPEAYWNAVRAQYLMAPGLAYFNTGGLGPTPRPVLEYVERTMRALQAESEHGHERLTAGREFMARFLGATPAEVAFVRNATEGNSIIAAGLGLAAGDEVIFDSHAHPGGSFVWFHQAQRRGVVVKLFDPDPESPEANVAKIRALMTPRTKVVQVSHVTAPTGVVLPVADIARLCRERGVWFHIDGAQSAGMIPFSLHAIGCDSFAASGHKWLGAPFETGVLYLRRDRLEAVTPLLVGSYSGELDYLPGEFKLTDSAVRFEYGTRNVAAILGLVEAARLQEQIGRERIAARGRELARRVRAGLASLPGVEILTPVREDLAGSMVTFRSSKLAFKPLFERLFKTHRFRCRPVSEQKLNAVRISLHLCTSREECDALVETTAKLLRAA